jgi:3-hydroxybutyrate dehydrogenase
LLGFNKVLALETADADITSNAICPAYLRTPLVDAQIKDQARTRGISEEEVIDRVMLAPMPKKAFITFEEIAAAIEYLISPLARNVTGQTITIDGGWTAQ